MDTQAFETLLNQAQHQADLAVSQNDPRHYRDAFATSLQAMRVLAAEAGNWRQMVARATEEYEGDEGI
ncbi:MAG: hypothetical protein V4812_03880 [Pseudomonadota bacterium]